MNELNCPAQMRGSVAACRFCIFTGGGPSTLCVRLMERYHKEQASKHLTLSPPPTVVQPNNFVESD